MGPSTVVAERIHSVFAFYGVREVAVAIKRFFFSSIEWMRGLGCEPNRVNLLDPAAPAKKLDDFNEWIARTPQPDFRNIVSFELHTFQPDSKRGWADPLLEAHYSRVDLLGNFAYWLANSAVTRLGLPNFDSADRELIECLAPEYGIAYSMPVSLGPGAYATGIYVSRPDADTAQGTEIALRISRWGSIGIKQRVYRRGLLRGVYPRNYLAPAHLDQLVGSMRLSDWISQDVGRGTLADIGNRLSLWTVPGDNVLAIERELWAAGIIFDWRRHS
jgi:hypothetical protein